VFNSDGISHDRSDVCRNWTFRNNVFIRLGMAANIGVPNSKWYNNLFYQCTTNTGSPLLWNKSIFSDATGGQCFNNVFIECGGNPLSTTAGWYTIEAVLGGSITADYNYVSGTSFATKSAAFFVEPHGINGGDPGMTSIAGLDFHLLSTSKLINKGSTVAGVDVDFDGNPRPGGSAYDIGPFEFVPPRPAAPKNLRVVP
jgi:hypothetical protein